MKELIEEHPNILTEELCEDIIEKIQEGDYDNILSVIPKHHEDWIKIEHLLYKNLLSCVSVYKKNRVKNVSVEPEHKELLESFQQKLGFTDFKIIRVVGSQNETKITHYGRENSRFHFLTFIFYLNETEQGHLVFGKKTVFPETGKLVIFPETPYLPYHGVSPPVDEVQYLITGYIDIIHDDL